MNKENKIFMLIVFIIFISAIGMIIYLKLNNNKETKKELNSTSGVEVVASLEDTITSDSSWCGTFQLVWNDMKNELIKEDIVFKQNLDIVKNLNKETFNDTMLSSDYYYKTYGLKTRELKKKIEEGIKNKFNQTSDLLNDISWDDNELNNDDSFTKRYLFYTMLYREFTYNKAFQVLDNGTFNGKGSIKYFGIGDKSTSEVREQIDVLFYKDKDNFAIKLNTKTNDEVIFYKNPIGNTFNEIYDNLVKNTNNYTGSKNFGSEDTFKAPMIDFNIKKEYTELENKKFYDKLNNEYEISKALQTIKFSLDENGGKVKSEAIIDIKNTSAIGDIREFNVDSTFALFLKEKDKEKPYLALKVEDITKFQQ